MAVTSQGSVQENSADRFPLLMERTESHESNDHVIDMERVGEPSSSLLHSSSPEGSDGPHHENGQSNGAHMIENSPPSSSSNGSNFRSSSLSRRSEGFGRRWSPFNTFLWISIELVFTIGQIVAAVIVLYLSRYENPQTPLFAWVVGYAAGCTLSLPFYYWRYLHSNWIIDQRTAQLRQSSPRGTPVPEPNSYITISLTRSSDEEDGRGASTGAWNGQNMQPAHARIGALVEHFKMALDCFFAVWFVVGNVWIFGGHSSSSDAPNLYRLCIVFLTFSCIGYAMPFILCAMICCCLPCIISMLGVREDMNGVRGATEESINSLPTHKFKVRKDQSDSDRYSPGVEEGGFIAAGTEKERAISGEDAVCCICLTRYEDDDELRELPCSHFFHTECVDKWLKINATCPLCKSDIGGSGSTSCENSSAVVESSEQVQGVRITSNQSNELRQ